MLFATTPSATFPPIALKIAYALPSAPATVISFAATAIFKASAFGAKMPVWSGTKLAASLEFTLTKKLYIYI